MVAPKCPAALDALVLTEGVICVAVFDRKTMEVLVYAGDRVYGEALSRAFYFAERLSADAPTIRAHHVDYTVYVRGGSRVSIAGIIKPGGNVSKTINRKLQMALKKAESDAGDRPELTIIHGKN